jgi:hypothetical protein
LTLVRFDGVGTNTLPRNLHEFFKQDKGKELTFRIFISSPPNDVKDVEVNPEHVIFNLKGVLVGKDYFRINHFLPPPFNLARGPTLLGKNIIPKLALKEFFLRCLKQFIVYI